MRSRVIFFVVTLILISAVSYFLWATNSSLFRMATLRCQEAVLYGTHGDIDYLVLGSSRTMQGVDPEVVEQNLPDGHTVVNISRSWRGNGQLYNMVEEFLERHTIEKGVVIEYSFVSYTDSASSTYGNGYYPNYALVSDVVDIWADFKSAPRAPLHNSIRDVLHHTVSAFDERLNRFFEGRYLSPWTLLNPYPDRVTKEITTTHCFKRDNKTKPKVLQKKSRQVYEKVGDWQESVFTGWNLNVINNDRHSYYIDKLRALSEQHGFKVYLMLVPTFLESPVSKEFVTELSQRHNLPVLAPAIDTRQKLYIENGYTDLTHMSHIGRAAFSEWLGQTLRQANMAID